MSEEQNLDYKQLSQLEHVKLRPNMYIGSISPQELDMYVLAEDENRELKFIQQKVKFSPGLLKIVDEILVNAIDHYTRNRKKVKTIEITFNIKNGKITVKNDGGIPIKLVDTINDGKRYQPEAIFSQFLSGSNFNGESRIVGGQNGIGAKAANAFSDLFRITTCNGGKLYVQNFKNRLQIIEDPVITESKEEPYTKVSFIPSYAALGYSNGYNEEIGQNLYKIIETRAYQAAAFVKCDVFFNKKKINIDNFKQFVDLFKTEENQIYQTVLAHPNKELNLEVCIGVSDGKFRQVSLLNGINVFMGGTHIKYIQNEIVEGIKKHVEKELNKTKSAGKFNTNIITNNLFLFVMGCVINPEFGSQSKEKLTTPIDKFQEYKFKASEWKSIWALLEPHIMNSILGKIKDKKQKRVIRGKVILEKGEDAKYAGDKKKAAECSLLICEGDSALTLVTRGVNHKKTELDKDYFGTFSIQGVPPNCRKLSKKITNKKDGVTHCIRSEKLKNNKRFSELVKICGLDYEKSYDAKTEEGREEFKTLRYGRVIVAVDQDEDGKGQIFGLLMNFFVYFWPSLLDWNFIKRFNTPIIRAYPKKDTDFVREFYSQHSFKEWVTKIFKGDEKNALKTFKVKYYKGLASHDVHEIRPLFNNFENRLLTYTLDEKAEESMEAYFGVETNFRKEILSSPVMPEDEIKEETIITVTKAAKSDIKEYQRDNILRKLPHSIDGLVPARRKTFYAARALFKVPNATEIKVFDFIGTAAGMTKYTHGHESLSNTAIKMAQSFVGARNLPLLIGVGQFGSRLMGGKDHGSSRYVSIKLNQKLTDALYPRCDDFLLTYQFIEGKRCEPCYYVPIIPTAILENMCIPATGWKAEIWSRDYRAVMKNVRAMIMGEIQKCKKLRIWLRGNKCDIRYGSDNNTYIVGKYIYDEKSDVLTVTELPPGVYNKEYIKSVAFDGENNLKPQFKDVYDHSNYDEDTNIDEIDIRFELNPGVMKEWNSKGNDKNSICSGVEKAMKLCIKVCSHINMITADGTIKEYKSYSTIVNEWFIERKKLYEERVMRMTILLKLQIRYVENIIRFTVEQDSYGITNKTPESKFIEILRQNKYDAFNKSLLFNPEYTPIKELEALILNHKDASYEYIVNLTYRQLLEEACQKRSDELIDLKQKLEEALSDCLVDEKKFIGQKTWLKELDVLEKIIDHGVTKGWAYKKNKPKFA